MFVENLPYGRITPFPFFFVETEARVFYLATI